MTDIDTLKVQIATQYAKIPTIAMGPIYTRLKEVIANETGEFDLVTVENAHIYMDLLKRELKLRRLPKYDTPLHKVPLFKRMSGRTAIVKVRRVGALEVARNAHVGMWATVHRHQDLFTVNFYDTFEDAIAAATKKGAGK